MKEIEHIGIQDVDGREISVGDLLMTPNSNNQEDLVRVTKYKGKQKDHAPYQIVGMNRWGYRATWEIVAHIADHVSKMRVVNQ